MRVGYIDYFQKLVRHNTIYQQPSTKWKGSVERYREREKQRPRRSLNSPQKKNRKSNFLSTLRCQLEKHHVVVRDYLKHWVSNLISMIVILLTHLISPKLLILDPNDHRLHQLMSLKQRKIGSLNFNEVSLNPLLQLENDGTYIYTKNSCFRGSQ